MKRMLAIVMVCMLAVGAFIIVPEGEGAPEVTRAPGRTLYVAPEKSTYTEIGYALVDAVDGDTIYVAPGIYTKGMMIGTNGITIIGNNTEGEVIVGQLGEGIGTIHAKWVNVSGITLTDDNNHIGLLSMVGAENVTVTNVKLVTSKISEGLYIRNGKALSFNNISVRTQDRQSVRIRESENITFKDFAFSCNTSMGGCFEIDTTDDIVLDEGSIEIRGSGTAIYNLEGMDLDLFGVDATYTEKFIMMETGNVSMYNMDIDPADILMDVPDPIHSVDSYYLRDIKLQVEVANGTTEPLQGGEINISQDGGSIYSTDHFNGTDPTSDINGEFDNPFPFLNWRKVGGDENAMGGSNVINVWFLGDHEVEMEIGAIDASITDDITINLTGIYDQVRSIEGHVTSLSVPVYSLPVVNASIKIFGENQTEIGNTTTNETGYFRIEGIPMGINYTMVVESLIFVEEGGLVSGYLRFESWVNLTKDEIFTVIIHYYEYIPPEAGPIFGYVNYQDGPSEGLFCEGAEVILLNFTGVIVGTTTTNASGFYEFEDVPFGIGYEVRITPPLDELGVNLEITGYLFWDGSGFIHNVSTGVNATLRYYDHVRPVSAHPKVTIIDEDDKVVEGAQVDVTIEGATYTSITNMFGIATFEGLDMETFPNGTEFRVSKEGYDDLEWTQGDPVQVFKETKDVKHVWLIIILVLIVMVIIAYAAYMIFFKKSPNEDIEE